MNTVYVVMNAEFVHPGHINIIKVARELGEVTVGLAADGFAANYKRLPLLSYTQRKTIIENIQGVKRVIPQDSLDLAAVLRELKPDFFIHGDDWVTGPMSSVRRQVIEVLNEWGGQLIEPPYTEGISSTIISQQVPWLGNIQTSRSHRFKRLLNYQPVIRILEVHDGLSGVLVDQAQVILSGKRKEFDAMLLTQSTDSLRKGKPAFDAEGSSSRLDTICEVLAVTSKPLLVEERKPFPGSQFAASLISLERLGVAAVVVEDSSGGDESFCQEISTAKNAQASIHFSILVRMNPCDTNPGQTPSYLRAKNLIHAGIDAFIMEVEPQNLPRFLDFYRAYEQFEQKVPILGLSPVDQPLDETGWIAAGMQGVVYGDHLLRSAYQTMKTTVEQVLLHAGTSGLDWNLTPLNKVYDEVLKQQPRLLLE